jgi:hypothetical protein
MCRVRVTGKRHGHQVEGSAGKRWCAMRRGMSEVDKAYWPLIRRYGYKRVVYAISTLMQRVDVPRENVFDELEKLLAKEAAR